MPKYKFADIAYNITDKKMPEPGDEDLYIGLEHLDSGSLRVTRWGSDVELVGQKLCMKKGDILFGRRNTYLRRAAIAPHDGIFSAHGMIFRPNTNVMDPDFFPFFISSDYFMDAAIRISVGSLSPTVNWKTLKELEFYLPDLEQQRKTSEILAAANETKEAYQDLLAKTDELVKSQFIEMFDNVINAEYIPLEQCCVSITGGNTPSMKHEEYYGGDVPFVKSGDIKDRYVASGALWLTQEALTNTNAKYVPKGTVVVVVRSGILKHDLPVAITLNPLVINQDIKAFQPKLEFTSQYLAWAIRSKENELLSMTKAMTVDSIDSKVLYSIPVMVASMELQLQFDAFVEQTDKSKFELKKAIENISELMKTILQQDLSC
jgi:type I restriction enzyme S subunit